MKTKFKTLFVKRIPDITKDESNDLFLRIYFDPCCEECLVGTKKELNTSL